MAGCFNPDFLATGATIGGGATNRAMGNFSFGSDGAGNGTLGQDSTAPGG